MSKPDEFKGSVDVRIVTNNGPPYLELSFSDLPQFVLEGIARCDHLRPTTGYVVDLVRVVTRYRDKP